MWADRCDFRFSQIDPENKGLIEVDPENKGVSKIDPENKGLNEFILKTKDLIEITLRVDGFPHEKRTARAIPVGDTDCVYPCVYCISLQEIIFIYRADRN